MNNASDFTPLSEETNEEMLGLLPWGWLTNEWLIRVAGTEKKSINVELWQACAGPLVNLPPAGTHVVYFPQGHSEQVRLWFLDSLV